METDYGSLSWGIGSTSPLSLCYMAPGMISYHQYCENQSYLKLAPFLTPRQPAYMYSNFILNQQCKLHLHKCCAHISWEQLNRWICGGQWSCNVGYVGGLLPCDSSLTSRSSPICVAYQFSKAHQCPHLSYTGHIATTHHSWDWS